jgi:hypothetical protein
MQDLPGVNTQDLLNHQIVWKLDGVHIEVRQYMALDGTSHGNYSARIALSFFSFFLSLVLSSLKTCLETTTPPRVRSGELMHCKFDVYIASLIYIASMFGGSECKCKFARAIQPRGYAV